MWWLLQTSALSLSCFPKSLCRALRFFDEEVRQCFSSCIAVDVPDAHWQQAQLSQSFGGLGLRSLSLHRCAAFISSLASSGYGSDANIHLQHAVTDINALVSQHDAISCVVASPSGVGHSHFSDLVGFFFTCK